MRSRFTAEISSEALSLSYRDDPNCTVQRLCTDKARQHSPTEIGLPIRILLRGYGFPAIAAQTWSLYN